MTFEELIAYAERTIPALVVGGLEAGPFIRKFAALLMSPTEPTDADQAELEAMEKPLRDELQEPE